MSSNSDQPTHHFFLDVEKHIFQVTIFEKLYHTYIKVGGNLFADCVEISIPKNGEFGKLLQVSSEPECGYPHFLGRGESVPMISVALLTATNIYKTTHFRFDDMSQIECSDVIETTNLPRKRKIPLSLAHMSIAMYGKTWYERHFGATMENTSAYERYRTAVKNLEKPIDISFDIFISQYSIHEEQIEGLRSLFEKADSWFDFFRSVPKTRHCELLYNWLPSCIQTLLDDTYIPMRWVIDTTKLPDIKFTSINQNAYANTYKRPAKTRKHRRSNIRVSNTFYTQQNIL